jgi:anthranilate phosphoribosyltransferase
LEGEVGPYRDIVAVNAAAALYVAERAPNLRAGLGLATEALASGAARAKLAALVDFTNENP